MRGIDAVSGAEGVQRPSLAGIPYRWVVAIAGVVLLLCTGIHAATFGVFFKPIAGEFGWGRGAMAGAFAMRCLVTATLCVPVGYWADKYGPRRVLLPCMILLGLSLIATTRVSNLWQMYLVQGLGVGVATAAPFVCVTSSVAKWHDKGRGLALGITVAGVGLSTIVFPPLATQLIDLFEWRWAIFLLGLAVILLAAPASLLMKNPPAAPTRQAVGVAAHKGVFAVWRLLPRFLKNWALLGTVALFLLSIGTGQLLTNHLVNYMTDIGITAMTAATMMSAMGIGNTVGRLGMGAISDRLGASKDYAICCVLLAIPPLLLLTQVPAVMWVAVILLGIGAGGTTPLVPALMGEHLSKEHLATATGVATTGGMIGMGLGPWLGGFMFDVFGNYFFAMLLAVAMSVGALIIVVFLPRAGHPSWRKAQALLDQ